MRIRKIMCSVLSAALLLGSFSATVYADEPEVITGTYTFTSEEGSNIQLTDEFVFREDCFMQSSFIGCAHLAALSAQAAMASSTRFGDDVDPYQRDPSNGAANILAMLTSMGFTDVEANAWYSTEAEDDSLAVAIGTRTLTVDGHAYTLLAIIPRSVNYRQEWSGNIDLGTGNIHEGFLEARDECLRFTKQYIQNHNITGDLKVWIAGHSRGGAVSNLVGGFLAGGGIGYFGGQVSITPEDIYCYTFATPRPVRPGVNTSVALSVAGARGGTYYADTPGDAYVYPEDMAIDLTGLEFTGIRNYPLEWDLIPYLPLADWGYTYYGNVYSFDNVSEEQMLAELQSISPYVYDYYVTGRSAYDFHEKTFDLASMSLVDIGGEGGTDAAIAYLRSRISGLMTMAPDSDSFVNGGIQTVLAGLAGIYGMMSPMFKTQEGLVGKLAQPLVFCYLAYASEKLINEGRAANEQEGIAIAVTELLEFFLGKSIDYTSYTVDEFIVDLASFVRDNKDSELVQKMVSMITTAVPETYQPIIRGYLGSFYPGYDDTTPLGDVVVAYLCACVDGADPASAAYSDDNNKTGEGVRKHSLYMIASLMPMLVPALQPVVDAIGYDDSHSLDGSGTFSGFIYAVITYLGGDNYTDIQTAADQKLGDALTTVFNDMLTAMDGIYPQSYIDDCRTHTDAVVANVHELRTVVMTLLLYNGGSFDTEANIRNLCTGAGNMGMIASTHYDETYIAYAKAAARMEPDHGGSSEQVIIYNMIAGRDVAWTGSGTISFTAERNIEPETTYDHFTAVVVDETLVDPSMYTTSRGSINVTLSEEFLQSLPEGRHLIRIQFNDPGCAEAYFYTANVVSQAPSDGASGDGSSSDAVPGDTSIASTGEQIDYTSMAVVFMMFAAGAVCLYLSVRMRRKAHGYEE